MPGVRPEERDLRDNRFPKSNRLLKSAEFRKVFDQGRKVVTSTLVFHYLRTHLTEPRLGLAVSRKVGKAVVRNKVKRRIREAFRLEKKRFPQAFDIVVYPRKGILDKHFDDYLQSFDILIAKIQRKARPPRNQ